MRKYTKLFLCLLCPLLLVAEASAQTTYSPSEDAYVQGGVNANTNYNTTNVVVKRGTIANYVRETYLKFDLLGGGLASTDVGKAVVRLYRVSDGGYSITAHKTGDNYTGTSTPWKESSLTWNNAPGVGASIYATTVGTTSKYYEWDITSYVKEQLNNSDRVISVVLRDNSNANLMASFASKESSVNKPQLVIQPSVNYSGTFYLDVQNGSDSNPGTQVAPWKTFANVNAGTFLPGSQILLKRGGVWSGRLSPKGSGSSANSNKINAYGSGNAPLINAGGTTIAGVYLTDQEYWEINNLEITNTNGTTNDQGELYGIYVVANNSGVEYRHIHIKNNHLHNVNGNVGGKSTGGIYVEVASVGQTRINDVLIEGNTIENMGGVGIQNRSTQTSRTATPGTNGSYYPWEDLVIRNNYISNIGRNGIIFRYSVGAIVEYNTVAFNSRYDTGHGIYNFGTDDGIVQFNEAYGNTGEGTDRGGFDADWASYGSVIQYNYSHDNDWFCGIMRRENENVDIRYNISQNEREYTIFYGFDADSELKNCRIYNNTFYVSSGISPIRAIKGTAIETTFSNNIFYYENATTLGTIGTNTSFSNNLYRGVPPRSSDPNPVTGDPLLVDPGSGGANIDMTNPELLAGYKMQAGSPAIGAGKLVTNNGGRDFFGNAVSSTTVPTIGAYNGSGSSTGFPDPDKWYKLENGKSDKLLASDVQNSNVALWSQSDNDFRQFRFTASSASGYWNIISKQTGQYVANDVNTNDAKLWSAQDTDHRRWKVKSSQAGGYYLLESKVNGKYLSSNNTFNNAVLWSAQDTDYRQWKFIEAGLVNTAARTTTVSAKPTENVELASDSELLTYPNPAGDELHLTYRASGTQTASYRLMDALGRQRQQGALITQPGTNHQRLNVSQLAPGLYLLKVSVNRQLHTQRIMVE